MEFNINAGRLTNPVAFLSQPDGSDDYGQPLGRVVDFNSWADMDVKSGEQLTRLGENLTSEMITCLMYYDPRAKNSGWLRDLVDNIDYEIQHVRHSRRYQSMIVTAKVERDE